jgi:CBS domain-containing protein
MTFFIYDQGNRVSTPAEALFKPGGVSRLAATRRIDRVGEDQKLPPESIKNKPGYASGEETTLSPALFAADIMTSPVSVIEYDRSIDDAWELLSNDHFHHLPIVNKQQALVGILSDRDILKAAAGRKLSQGLPEDIATIMTQQVVTASEDTEIRILADVMSKNRFSAVPIVAEDNRVLGIVTRSDILKVLVNHAALELWA